MKPGELARMKSATVQFGSPKVRGSCTMKAVAGREMMFLYLGSVDAKAPESFEARQALIDMGWIPNPVFQAELDAEAAEAAKAIGVAP